MQNKTRTWFVKYRLKIAIFFVLALTFLATINSGAIYRQLDSWRLIPRSEKLTELYFTDHQTLLRKYTPNSAYTVEFTVHNIEQQLVNYTYEIIQRDDLGGINHVLVTGSFDLDNDSFHYESVPITYVDAGNQSSIIIHLINKDQSITYHLERQ